MVKEIDRAEWAPFLESFTLAHDHWLVHVDGESEALPLAGITMRDGATIVIHLGADISHHRVITIDAAQVSVQETDDADEALVVLSSNGHATQLRLVRP